jgi:hypothetical protein
MNPDTVAVLIPIVAIGGFFSWMIARTLTGVYTARLQAQRDAGKGGAGQDQVLAAIEEVRREVAELAERVDFTERLLAKSRESDRLIPPR